MCQLCRETVTIRSRRDREPLERSHDRAQDRGVADRGGHRRGLALAAHGRAHRRLYERGTRRGDRRRHRSDRPAAAAGGGARPARARPGDLPHGPVPPALGLGVPAALRRSRLRTAHPADGGGAGRALRGRRRTSRRTARRSHAGPRGGALLVPARAYARGALLLRPAHGRGRRARVRAPRVPRRSTDDPSQRGLGCSSSTSRSSVSTTGRR